jgi:hypothetical protein
MQNLPAVSAIAGVALGMMFISSASGDQIAAPGLQVGWSTTDITPAKPVSLVGFFEKRISTGVRDPLTATALALESRRPNGVAEQAILVSCDLLWIRKSTQDRVRRLLKDRIAGFDADKLLLNATHTHQGPLQESGVFGPSHDVTPQEQAQGQRFVACNASSRDLDFIRKRRS